MRQKRLNNPIELAPIERIDALSGLAAPLLEWYDQHARVLPWRSDPTPYHVWVSEIMLQQTRVETVKPYYHRFMAALPDVAALSMAGRNQLQKLWEGLGYYNRVYHLQQAAVQVMQEFGGQIPADYDALLSLPGIGEYTAGAIASIAYGIKVPAVDGNVLRILSRLLASDADIKQPKVKKAFTSAAAGMQPEDRPGDFNQALMDLGATVCLPNQPPNCSACPLSGGCRACELGTPSSFPVKSVQKPRSVCALSVFLITAEQAVLLHRRPEGGLLGGLWEFPNEPLLSPEEVKARFPCPVTALRRAKHLFTHVEWRMSGWWIRFEKKFSPPENCAWVDLTEIREHYALPGAFKAYTALLPKLLG